MFAPLGHISLYCLVFDCQELIIDDRKVKFDAGGLILNHFLSSVSAGQKAEVDVFDDMLVLACILILVQSVYYK